MVKENKKCSRDVKDPELQQAFSAFGGSMNRYMDPESAEGLDIIGIANHIMEKVHPTWVAPNKPTKSTTDPTWQSTRKRQTEEPSTTPKSDPSAVTTNPAKRTWVAYAQTELRRSTRSTSSGASVVDFGVAEADPPKLHRSLQS